MINHHDEQGFTLLETIFALSIFLLVVSISFLLLKPHNELLERQQFFSQLKADLLFAQHYALTNQKLVTVNFLEHDFYYVISNQNGEILLTRTYSEKIKLMKGTQNLFLRYRSNGNVSTFGSFSIYINDKRYKMVFQIGRGRFYIEEA